jgi:hypothetical protein
MTSTTIDFRTLPVNIPSLCIPRVFTNIDEKRIRRVFDELNMGIIESIDIICKTTVKGEKFNRVYVHFKKWFTNNVNADTARERLLNGKDIKIIYDDPWFWKVSAYREKSYPQRLPQDNKKVSIHFDDDNVNVYNSKLEHSTNNFEYDNKNPNTQMNIPVPKLKRNIAKTYSTKIVSKPMNINVVNK